MHVFKYHAVANHVQSYYVSIKMNCHIKSVVLGEGKRRMWMESRWLWKRRLRSSGSSLRCTADDRVYSEEDRERKPSITEAAVWTSTSLEWRSGNDGYIRQIPKNNFWTFQLGSLSQHTGEGGPRNWLAWIPAHLTLDSLLGLMQTVKEEYRKY